MKYLTPSTEIIRVDDLDANLSMASRIAIYINNIQTAYDNGIDNIIIDLAHDTVDFRNSILSKLKFSQHIPVHFFTISLRPGVDKILEWDATRRGLSTISDEDRTMIEKCYERFESPTIQEFILYDFISITTLEVNNTNLNESIQEVVEYIL